jgi:hypothetical protein
VHLHKGGRVAKRSSLKVLDDINRLTSELTAFKSCLTDAAAAEAFRRLLPPPHAAAADFYVAVDALRNDKATGATTPSLHAAISTIHERFFSDPEGGDYLPLPPSVLSAMRTQLIAPVVGLSIFNEALGVATDVLQSTHEAFKESGEYKELKLEPESRACASEQRGVAVFEPHTLQSFLLKVKGLKRSRDIKFSKKLNVFTIGRDKSNNLVIEDSRVSRSHARVEYNDRQCEYIDLGSSCGSKLNGRPVLRAKLQPGDVVELGQSTLIFQLKKRSKFSIFGRFSSA